MRFALRTLLLPAAATAAMVLATGGVSIAAKAPVTIAQQLAQTCSDAGRAQALDARAEAQTRRGGDSYAAFTQAAELYAACRLRTGDTQLQNLFMLAYLGDIVGAANSKSTSLGNSLNLLRHAQSVADSLLDASTDPNVRTIATRYRALISAELEQEAALSR